MQVRAARMPVAAVVAIAACAFSSGCSKKPAENLAQNPTTATAATQAAPTASIAHGTRKMKNVDVPVIVDGKEVAVLRYGELPPGLSAHTDPASEGSPSRYYRVAEYLSAIGVDVSHLKAVHFAGNRDHLAGLTGEELRAEPARFVFDFMEEKTGIAKMDWETTGLQDQLRIDEIRAINVFVAREPAKVDAHRHCYLDLNGDCRPVSTMVDGDLVKGTRIYVDGKMVGAVKRKNVGDALVIGKTESGDDAYSFEKYFHTLHVDTSDVRAVDFMVGDDVVARADRAAWEADRASLAFALIRHQHGKVFAQIPADLLKGADKARSVQVTAIKVYRAAVAAPVDLVAVDDVVSPPALPDDAPAALASDGTHERDREAE